MARLGKNRNAYSILMGKEVKKRHNESWGNMKVGNEERNGITCSQH